MANLTAKDRKYLEIAETVSVQLRGIIGSNKLKEDFWNTWGKISFTRDAGAGRGSGKLQRDALCTRGDAKQNPISNRNLRWHPVVVTGNKKLTRNYEKGSLGWRRGSFEVRIGRRRFIDKDVWNLERKVYFLPNDFKPFKEKYIRWTEEWKKHKFVIPILEASTPQSSLEVYAVLGVGCLSLYADEKKIKNAFPDIVDSLKKQFARIGLSLSENFPSPNRVAHLLRCPLCKERLDKPPILTKTTREKTFLLPGKKSKRSEGKAGSIQLMHILPLIQQEERHNPKYVRYGHRWCNVAMTDHDLKETIKFFTEVLRMSG